MYSLTADQIDLIFWGYFLLLTLLAGFGVKIYYQAQQIKQLKEDDKAWWASYRRLLNENDSLRRQQR
jgi:hypothetical protein